MYGNELFNQILIAKHQKKSTLASTHPEENMRRCNSDFKIIFVVWSSEGISPDSHSQECVQFWQSLQCDNVLPPFTSVTKVSHFLTWNKRLFVLEERFEMSEVTTFHSHRRRGEIIHHNCIPDFGDSRRLPENTKGVKHFVARITVRIHSCSYILLFLVRTQLFWLLFTFFKISLFLKNLKISILKHFRSHPETPWRKYLQALINQTTRL